MSKARTPPARLGAQCYIFLRFILQEVISKQTNENKTFNYHSNGFTALDNWLELKTSAHVISFMSLLNRFASPRLCLFAVCEYRVFVLSFISFFLAMGKQSFADYRFISLSGEEQDALIVQYYHSQIIWILFFKAAGVPEDVRASPSSVDEVADDASHWKCGEDLLSPCERGANLTQFNWCVNQMRTMLRCRSIHLHTLRHKHNKVPIRWRRMLWYQSYEKKAPAATVQLPHSLPALIEMINYAALCFGSFPLAAVPLRKYRWRTGSVRLLRSEINHDATSQEQT